MSADRSTIWTSALAVLVASVACIANVFAGDLVCNTENSSCAKTRAKNGFYRADAKPGTVLSQSEVRIAFPSRSDDHQPDVVVTKPASAPLCVIWAEETDTPYANPEPDGRVEGARLETWRPGRPSGCAEVDEGVPWRRADDLMSSWPYRATFVVAGLGVLFLAIGLGLSMRRARLAGAVLCLASGPVWALVWLT